MKNEKQVVIMAWRDRWNPDWGGAEKFIQNMAEEIASRGHEVIFLTARYKGSKKEEVINEVKYIRIGNKVTVYTLATLYYLLKLKSKTSLLIENFNAVPFLIPLFNKKNIVVIHHLQVEEWKKFFGNFLGSIIAWVMNHLLLLFYKRQKIVTVSESSKDELLKYGFKPKSLDIVYNGIDLPISNDIEKPKKTINLCYMGRIVKPKHIDEAISLVDYCVNELKIKNVKMEIGGGGPEEDNLKELVNKLNLNEHVQFLGRITDEEKVELFKRSHLFIMLSHKEGWGITILEAASQATPTLGYNVQGVKDSLHPDTGYLIETKDDLKIPFKSIIKDIKNNADKYVEKKRKCLEWASKFEWKVQREKFWNLVKKDISLENQY